VLLIRPRASGDELNFSSGLTLDTHNNNIRKHCTQPSVDDESLVFFHPIPLEEDAGQHQIADSILY
jgi:hypothetical protein